jgi:hypothetical protein
MKNITRIAILGLLAVAAAFAQQHSIVQTSLSAAITANQTSFAVASATGINAATASVPGSVLYVVDIGQTKGEPMPVISLSSTTVTVRRTQGRAVAHASGAMVLVATAANWFYSVDPVGTCTAASVYASPWVNITTGNQWLCSSQTGTWVPGWGNTTAPAQLLTATATASVAGATAIAGPLVEISGTEAITSFTMSVGWNGQGFCVQPTAAFTTVAGNNIAEASTADANQHLCFVYNARAAAFSSSY